MRIRGNKLKKAMETGGFTTQQLAEAIAEPGFNAKDAASALNNWSAGRDHPRAKAATIARLAGVLKVQTKDLAVFTSRVKGNRGSPRKARLLADLIRGKNVDAALNLLTFTTKRAAVNIKKCLNAAIADAETAECDITRLYVTESHVDEGTRMKRFQPKDRGRAHAIVKQLNHITISVEERGQKA